MVTTTEIALRMAAAVALGGLIGSERGRRDHPAGLRTHMLVTLAAATFMLISTELFHHAHYDRPDRVTFDPSRVASYVVAGIGFLGAGSILRTGSDIKGLTTAASLWMTTATGLAAGAGMYATALAGTALALAILTLARSLEHHPHKPSHRRIRVTIGGGGPGPGPDGLSALLGQCDVEASATRIDRRLGDRPSTVVTLSAQVKDDGLAAALARLEALPGVLRIRVDPDRPPGGEES